MGDYMLASQFIVHHCYVVDDDDDNDNDDVDQSERVEIESFSLLFLLRRRRPLLFSLFDSVLMKFVRMFHLMLERTLDTLNKFVR